jgi:hypothetical protein
MSCDYQARMGDMGTAWYLNSRSQRMVCFRIDSWALSLNGSGETDLEIGYRPEPSAGWGGSHGW